MASNGNAGTTRTVAGNTAWYALELAVTLIQRIAIGVPVARMIGPEQLGYFNYIQWLTTVTGVLGTVGIPVAARKYLSEYLAKDDKETADRIYGHLFRIQFALGAGLVSIGLALVFAFCNPLYLTAAVLLVISVLPRMLLLIPSNANVAAQDMRSNVAPALIAVTYECVVVGAGLWFGWGLIGVAWGQVSSYALELVLKLRAIRKWLPRARPGVLPAELQQRMTRFSGESLALLALNLIVWDRSDVFFLKMLESDTRQVAFFSLAFTLVDRILVMPKSFALSVGANIMAEFGRDRERLNRVVALAARYSLLFAMPVMIGLAAISGPLITLVYGEKYLPVIPILAIGAALAVAKPLLDPVQNLMQAAEQQRFLILWGIVCAIINVTLDLVLIPRASAEGAMWANGLAQAIAIAGIWIRAVQLFGIRLPLGALARIAVCGSAMGAAVHAAGKLPLPLILLLILQVSLGALLYPLLLRLAGVLDSSDLARFQRLSNAAPARFRRAMDALVRFLTGPLGAPGV